MVLIRPRIPRKEQPGLAAGKLIGALDQEAIIPIIARSVQGLSRAGTCLAGMDRISVPGGMSALLSGIAGLTVICDR